MRDEFAKAADILEGQRRAEARLRREIARKCDWWDPEDVAAYAQDERRRVRKDVLDRLAKERRCPVCLKIKEGSRQWVVNAKGSFAVCKSCRDHAKRPMQAVSLTGVFTAVISYRLDGPKLKAARDASNMSLGVLAKRSGVNKGTLSKLEGTVSEVTEEIARRIQRGFEGLPTVVDPQP